MNLNKCRVCLAISETKFLSVFEKYRDNFYYKHINSLTNVEIEKDDGLPHQICPHCILELEAAINFKDKCEHSNLLLKAASLNGADEFSGRDGFLFECKDFTIKKEDVNEIDDEIISESTYIEYPTAVPFTTLLSDTKVPRAKVISKSATLKNNVIDLQLECNECGGKFMSKCKLRVHWKRVHLPVFLTCKHCKKKFTTFKAFNNHVKNNNRTCSLVKSGRIYIEGEGKSRVLCCKVCDYNTRKVQVLKAHILIHTGEKPFQCQLCMQRFSQMSSLQMHKERKHKLIIVQKTCQFCGKLITGRDNVNRHLNSHKNISVQCDICKKIFKTKKILTIHMLRHQNVKNFTCEICAKTCYTKGELHTHINNQHQLNKTYFQCKICAYKSVKKFAIQKHEKQHSGLNFSCIVCGMFFNKELELVRHQKKHTEEGKLPCPDCDRKFLTKKSLGKHRREKHNICMLNNQSMKKRCFEVSKDKINCLKIEHLTTSTDRINKKI